MEGLIKVCTVYPNVLFDLTPFGQPKRTSCFQKKYKLVYHALHLCLQESLQLSASGAAIRWVRERVRADGGRQRE